MARNTYPCQPPPPPPTFGAENRCSAEALRRSYIGRLVWRRYGPDLFRLFFVTISHSRNRAFDGNRVVDGTRGVCPLRNYHLTCCRSGERARLLMEA